MAFEYHVNPDIDIPLYEQLVTMISSDISNGRLPGGTRLPTVRELSDSCSIARGTVIRAYDELEQLGAIEKIQGRGTFVCTHEESRLSRKELAMEAIDRMLDSLEALNFSKAEIDIYLNLKLREREIAMKRVNVAVVECNYEVLSEISEQIRALGDIDVYPFILDDIRAYPYKLQDDIDLIIVSAAHAEELQRLLPDSSKLAKAALRLQPRAVSEIVRLTPGKRTGILCKSERFGNLVAGAVETYTGSPASEQPHVFGDVTRGYINGLDVLLLPPNYSKFCSAELASAIVSFGKSKPVIECEYRIDDGSLIYIKDRIEKIRARE